MFKLLGLLSPLIGAERAHNATVALLRILGHTPGTKWLMKRLYTVEHPSLEREVFGMKFRNPIGMAAGFDRNGDIYPVLDSLGFGFVEIGTVTPRAQQGNPKPRIFRLPKDSAILNRIGLVSQGLDTVISNVRHEHPNIIIGCNIGKNTVTPPAEAPNDYLRVFRNLYQYVDYFTVNVSYNTSHKQYVPRTRESIMEIIEPLFDFRRGQNQYRPILLKISPDISDEEVDLMTDIMVDTPLDGIVATNATTNASDMQTPQQTLHQIGYGVISGRPLTKRAIEVVARVHRRCNGTYPIIGVGGLMNGEDVKAMLDAGASLVQVYTGFIYNGPSFAGKLCRSLIEEPQNTNTEANTSEQQQ